jgi:hypothetical protein
MSLHREHGQSVSSPFRSIVLALIAVSLPSIRGADDEAAGRGPRTDSAGIEFFERKVRPILVARCTECHAGAEAEAGLSLDSPNGIRHGGGGGPVLVAGNPDESRLIKAVRYVDADMQMPPSGKLDAAEIKVLEEWVRRGAPMPAGPATGGPKAASFDLAGRKASHWAWRPLARPDVPLVQDRAWPRSESDRFLLARLEAEGLRPAPDADAPTWLRRVTFDLTGLPPSVAEIEAFVDDRSADARAKVVDRLLASPRYGERQARHWLDLMRYAESRGHEFDFTVPAAWRYRDYVIRAFNADVPFDRFVLEHVAGDRLAPRRNPDQGFNESILATTWWLLGEEVHSPVDIRMDQADRFDNRIDVLGKAFLGMTVACARCHDHKFDAISARDYHAVFGFSSSMMSGLAPIQDAEATAKLAQRLAENDRRAANDLRTTLAGVLREQLAAVPGKRSGTEKQVLAGGVSESPEGSAGRSTLVWSPSAGPGFTLADDPAFVSRATSSFDLDPTAKSARFVTEPGLHFDRVWERRFVGVESLREAGALGQLDRAGKTWRTPTVVIESGVFHYRVRGGGMARATVGEHGLVNGPLHGRLVQRFGDDPNPRWIRHDLTPYKGLRVAFEFTADPATGFALFEVIQGEPPGATSPPAPASADDLGTLLALLETGANASSPGQRARLLTLANQVLERPADFGLGPDSARRLAECQRRVAEARERLAAEIKPVVGTALVVGEASPVDEPVFLRGQPKNPGPVVPRRFLEALVGDRPIIDPATPDRASAVGTGRLELARQMVDPKLSPLTPRVIVNRVWKRLFGRGLIGSPDNLGVLGEAPSHPELLDRLADEFVRDGWSIKRLYRRLALSHAYAMGSRGDRSAETKDPANRLWHRMPVRRLDAEAIRDATLAISGRLDPTMFGAPVPVAIGEFQDGRGKPAPGPLDGDGRRAIYLSVRRNFLLPMLTAFDAPTPFTSIGRRTDSNVPAQALILLNDPFIHAEAERWAKRETTAGGDTDASLRRMYLAAYGREPDPGELAACREFLARAADPTVARRDLAHAMLAAKEFLFLR